MAEVKMHKFCHILFKMVGRDSPHVQVPRKLDSSVALCGAVFIHIKAHLLFYDQVSNSIDPTCRVGHAQQGQNSQLAVTVAVLTHHGAHLATQTEPLQGALPHTLCRPAQPAIFRLQHIARAEREQVSDKPKLILTLYIPHFSTKNEFAD